jgi:hypothetical protein
VLTVALALLAASPTATTNAGQTRVLVLETRADAAYLDKVKAFGDLLATILEQRTSAEIVPSSSVKDRLAVAADKLSAGCDETSCMTEIAGALDARWVVASRASQVGGRWLMRVELFDSQTLKVVAEVSEMSDSVEGIAAQAEHVADDLLAKSPMLPKKGASSSSSSSSSSTSTSSSAKPAAKVGDDKSSNTLPWALAGGGAGLAVLALGGWTAAWLWAHGEETKRADALNAYNLDPLSPDKRSALATTGQSADSASTVNNCVAAPIGCLSLPLLGIAGAGVYWGVTSSNEEPAP